MNRIIPLRILHDYRCGSENISRVSVTVQITFQKYIYDVLFSLLLDHSGIFHAKQTLQKLIRILIFDNKMNGF